MESLRASRIDRFRSEPIIVSSETPISEVMGILEQKGAYEAFIQDGKRVGMITIREILKVSDISGMKASSLMFYVPKLSPDDTVGKAAKLMNDYRLRALPVIDDEKIEYAVTTRTLCEAFLSKSKLRNVRISRIMTRNPVTIDGGEPISKARRLMIENGIDHLPVLDSGVLSGILLSNHIVRSMIPLEGIEQGAFISAPSGLMDIKVSGMMDPNVLVCDTKERALHVLRRMIENGTTYYVIGLWHEIQGIVTYRDFILFLAEPEEPDVPAYIIGLPDDPFEAQLAKMKFMRNAKALRRASPKIEEIYSTIRRRDVSGGRCRYEVNVSVRSAGKTHIYSMEGWDLPSIFDSITDKMKRTLTKKQVKRRRRSRRKMPNA